MTRPLSVSLISIFSIVFGVICLSGYCYTATSSESREFLQTFYDDINKRALLRLPMDVHFAYGGAASLLNIISGIFMLRGRNWARLLFLTLGVLGILLNLAFYGPNIIILINVGVFSFFFYFLVRRRALIFFGARNPSS